LEVEDFELLRIFGNEVRVEILRLLLDFDFRSLSEIAAGLKKRGWEMTLSGVLKHMRELEKAGLVRHEAGIFGEKPDARKTIYFLEGRERVKRILALLEGDIISLLRVGVVFGEAARIARQMLGTGRSLSGRDKKRLESLIAECESEAIYKFLTEDEKKKLKFWKMMLSIM
jgi:DNA-binding transcriptional ArsR family regulator